MYIHIPCRLFICVIKKEARIHMDDRLTLDVETRSTAKLQEDGQYAYAAAKGFALLELSYSFK